MYPKRKWLCLSAVIVLIFPVLYQAVTDSAPRWMPWRVAEFWRFHRLFSQRVNSWPAYHVQFLGSRDRWHPVSTRSVDREIIYGHFSRLDRLLQVMDANSAAPGAAALRRRVLDPVAATCLTRAGPMATADLPIRAVRFVRTLHPSITGPPPYAAWAGRLAQARTNAALTVIHRYDIEP